MTRVAVIGCGPSGMFFLHALALRRKRLEEDGDTAAIATLPDVTCFERSASPGGLWRSDRNTANNVGEGKKEDETPQADSNKMYEGLWTNAPKEAIEFFDYTYDEHFGRAMPVYMPRQLILEYMMARCTKNNPNLFRDVKFNTTVKSVTFDEDLEQFDIQTVNADGSSTESFFDKCIWAAGENGIPTIPKDTSRVLSMGGFKGVVVHSSKSGSNFDELVCGKKVLLIGDSYSAEDLTLQAIKLGVKNVDIISRSGEGICVETGSWPNGCVRVYKEYELTSVTNDGRGVVVTSDTEGEAVLNDIETVICCTGYSPKMNMLDPSLVPASKWPCLEEDDFEDYEMLKDWQMPKNSMSEVLGDIPLGKISQPGYVRHDIYRGQLMKNPNMMYFLERTDTPLLDMDIQAWLLLARITGDLPLPSKDEMRKFNLLTLLEGYKNPYIRYDSEENYGQRWCSFAKDHADYWSNDLSDERAKQLHRDHSDFNCRLLARDMQDVKYPTQIGTFNKLNEKGRSLVNLDVWSSHARTCLNKESPDASWRTFRDEKTPSKYYSIMTGTRAAPLKYRWLELDGCSVDEIVDAAKHFKSDARSPLKSAIEANALKSIIPGPATELCDALVETPCDSIHTNDNELMVGTTLSNLESVNKKRVLPATLVPAVPNTSSIVVVEEQRDVPPTPVPLKCTIIGPVTELYDVSVDTPCDFIHSNDNELMVGTTLSNLESVDKKIVLPATLVPAVPNTSSIVVEEAQRGVSPTTVPLKCTIIGPVTELYDDSVDTSCDFILSSDNELMVGTTMSNLDKKIVLPATLVPAAPNTSSIVVEEEQRDVSPATVRGREVEPTHSSKFQTCDLREGME